MFGEGASTEEEAPLRLTWAVWSKLPFISSSFRMSAFLKCWNKFLDSVGDSRGTGTGSKGRGMSSHTISQHRRVSVGLFLRTERSSRTKHLPPHRSLLAAGTTTNGEQTVSGGWERRIEGRVRFLYLILPFFMKKVKWLMKSDFFLLFNDPPSSPTLYSAPPPRRPKPANLFLMLNFLTSDWGIRRWRRREKNPIVMLSPCPSPSLTLEWIQRTNQNEPK